MDTYSTEMFGRNFLAFGPFLILLLGVGATVLGAFLTTGDRRWLILFLGPLAALGIAFVATWFVIAVLRPGEGSGFLLGGTTLVLYTMALFPYYGVLMVVRIRGGPRFEVQTGAAGPPIHSDDARP